MVSNALEALVDDIEAELQQRARREITSTEIGELVLKRLKQVNEVAYIRFASVYRQFQGIQDFTETLNHLNAETKVSTSPDTTVDSRLNAMIS